MRVMQLARTVDLADCEAPLEFADVPRPEPGPGEILLEVLTCGVCHTELDEIEGRTPPPTFPVVPGHEVIGRVAALGEGASRHRLGERLGVGWIHSSDGSELENLSPCFCATGRDHDGGYAEFMTVPEDYAFPIPDIFTDAQAAPLLCAGAIGYRALRLTGLADGEPLGLTGFGGSAHLVLQLCRHLYPRSPIHVFARDAAARQFAAQLGADWVGETGELSPLPLRAIIDTTPAWTPVVNAMRNLQPGGRLVINAIRKEAGDREALLDINYHEDLWLEREIKSVANIAGRDIREFLQIAGDIPLRPEVQTYALEEANRALWELKHQSVRGAKVLLISSDASA